MQKTKTILFINLIILFGLNLSSCAHKIPDEPICIELNPAKGYCTYTISEKSATIEGETWVKLKSQSLLMPISSWKEIKEFILKICADYGKCEVAENKVQEIENAQLYRGVP